jgi:hypothetical protein
MLSIYIYNNFLNNFFKKNHIPQYQIQTNNYKPIKYLIAEFLNVN